MLGNLFTGIAEGLVKEDKEARQIRLENVRAFNEQVRFASEMGMAPDPTELSKMAESITGGSNWQMAAMPGAEIRERLSEGLQRNQKERKAAQDFKILQTQTARDTFFNNALTDHFLADGKVEGVQDYFKSRFGDTPDTLNAANSWLSGKDLKAVRSNIFTSRANELEKFVSAYDTEQSIRARYSGMPTELVERLVAVQRAKSGAEAARNWPSQVESVMRLADSGVFSKPDADGKLTFNLEAATSALKTLRIPENKLAELLPLLQAKSVEAGRVASVTRQKDELSLARTSVEAGNAITDVVMRNSGLRDSIVNGSIEADQLRAQLVGTMPQAASIINQPGFVERLITDVRSAETSRLAEAARVARPNTMGEVIKYADQGAFSVTGADGSVRFDGEAFKRYALTRGLSQADINDIYPVVSGIGSRAADVMKAGDNTRARQAAEAELTLVGTLENVILKSPELRAMISESGANFDLSNLQARLSRLAPGAERLINDRDLLGQVVERVKIKDFKDEEDRYTSAYSAAYAKALAESNRENSPFEDSKKTVLNLAAKLGNKDNYTAPVLRVIADQVFIPGSSMDAASEVIAKHINAVKSDPEARAKSGVIAKKIIEDLFSQRLASNLSAERQNYAERVAQAAAGVRPQRFEQYISGPYGRQGFEEAVSRQYADPGRSMNEATTMDQWRERRRTALSLIDRNIQELDKETSQPSKFLNFDAAQVRDLRNDMVRYREQLANSQPVLPLPENEMERLRNFRAAGRAPGPIVDNPPINPRPYGEPQPNRERQSSLPPALDRSLPQIESMFRSLPPRATNSNLAMAAGDMEETYGLPRQVIVEIVRDQQTVPSFVLNAVEAGERARRFIENGEANSLPASAAQRAVERARADVRKADEVNTAYNRFLSSNDLRRLDPARYYDNVREFLGRPEAVPYVQGLARQLRVDVNEAARLVMQYIEASESGQLNR